MKLTITHQTKYTYDEPVQYALQQLRLTPKTRDGQSVVRWMTSVEGGKKELEFTDQHNNLVELISFEPERSEITILCEGEVETSDKSGILGEHGGYAPLWYFKRETKLTEAGGLVTTLAEQLGDGFEGDIAKLHALSAKITESVPYEKGQTSSVSTAEDAMKAGHGVCQDHAHIFISAARHLGFPARYVSGYLMMTDRIDQDASHAWAEAHVDGIGWVGFDVSNGISPDERYVAVATGLDYKEAAPISGMRFGEAAESMVVSLQVQQ
jgi:transglutaminase-like putative cysteine protease